MATKGTYTAYQALRPLEGDFGDTAEKAADRKIAADERKRLENERRTAKQKAISDSFQQDYNTLSEVITNNKSIDEAFARGVGEARDMMGGIYKQIQQNPALANDVDVQLKLQNLRNFSKNLKTVSTRYTDHATKITEGIQNGTISAWEDDKLNQVDSIFRQANLAVRPDWSTGLPIGATQKVDENGDPVLDEYGAKEVDDLNLIEVLDGRGLGELTNIYNMSEEAQTIGPDLGKRVIKKPDGSFSHIEYQLFEDIEPDVRNLVKGFIGDTRNPSPIAKSIWSDVLGNKSKELDDADMKEIEDAYTQTIKAFYDEKSQGTTDFSARNAAIKEANRKKEVKKLETVASEFTVVTDQDENIVKEEFIGVTGDIQGMATGFSLPVDPKTKKDVAIVTGAEGHDVVVNRVYLLDSGELAYSGFELRGKVTGQPLEPSTELFDSGGGKLASNVIRRDIGGGMSDDDPVLTGVAKAYGLDNEGQLKKMLEGKVEAFNKKNKKAPVDTSKMTDAELIELYSKE